MTLYAITIPPCPGFGFQGGAEFDTLIRQMENGRNRRIPRRYIGLHRYVAPMNNITLQAAQSIKRVHMAMLGSAHCFLHVDYLDCQATDEPFGTGDGSTVAFQLSKTYDPGGGATHERDIKTPDTTGAISIQHDGGVPLVVKVAGVTTTVTVNAMTGIVTFSSARQRLGPRSHGRAGSTSPCASTATTCRSRSTTCPARSTSPTARWS